MLKKIIKVALLFIVFCVGLILFSNYRIEKSTSKFIFDTVKEIPNNKVGVVLGTSKYLNNKTINLYYKYRLNAAFELYSKGKIEFILISGDNSTKNYDEPSTFKNDLIDLGVPESKIYLDYAGFRTLDSMVRAKEIFGLNKFTVISQKFHNQRAVYLAKQYGINAVGYNAKNVSSRYGFKTNVREKLARVKAFIDVLFNIQPKFLGEKIEIK